MPCVLISFEFEHILLWRGPEWKSSLLTLEDNTIGSEKGKAASASGMPESVELSPPFINLNSSFNGLDQDMASASIPAGSEEGIHENHQCATNTIKPEDIQTSEFQTVLKESTSSMDSESKKDFSDTFSENDEVAAEEDTLESVGDTKNMSESTSTPHDKIPKPSKSSFPMEAVNLLWQQALEQGTALLLEDTPLNADIIHARAVAFSQSAPPGPLFYFFPRRAPYKKSERQEDANEIPQKFEPITLEDEVKEVKPIKLPLPTPPPKRASGRMIVRSQINKEVFKEDPIRVARGTLGVDELAKLLA